MEARHRVAMDRNIPGTLVTLSYHICKRAEGFQRGKIATVILCRYNSPPFILKAFRNSD